MIDISFIIVNWNTKKLLIQCIDSLYLNIDQHKIEVIIVDNGSTDGSQKAVKDLFPSATLIENECNLGFAKANNIGIQQSTGRYICLVNSDVKVLNHCGDQMCAYMDLNPSIGVLGPKILNPDLTLRKNCREFPNLWNSLCSASGIAKIFPRSKIFSGTLMTYFNHNEIISVDVLPGCFLMARREAFEQVGLLDERFFIYSEDKDWCKRFQMMKWDVVFFPECEVIHYAGASASNEPRRFLIEKLKADQQYWRKHHHLISRSIYRMILLFHYFGRVVILSIFFVIRVKKPLQIKVKLSEKYSCFKWVLNNNNSQINIR